MIAAERSNRPPKDRWIHEKGSGNGLLITPGQRWREYFIIITWSGFKPSADSRICQSDCARKLGIGDLHTGQAHPSLTTWSWVHQCFVNPKWLAKSKFKVCFGGSINVECGYRCWEFVLWVGLGFGTRPKEETSELFHRLEPVFWLLLVEDS